MFPCGLQPLAWPRKISDFIIVAIFCGAGNIYFPVGLQGYATKIYTPPPINIVAMFYPFSQFCEIDVSLRSL